MNKVITDIAGRTTTIEDGKVYVAVVAPSWDLGRPFAITNLAHWNDEDEYICCHDNYHHAPSNTKIHFDGFAPQYKVFRIFTDAEWRKVLNGFAA